MAAANLTVDLADVQGNILMGYNYPFVHHVIVTVGDPTAARQFLRAVVSGAGDVLQLTTAEMWDDGAKPDVCLNVGVTAAGLRQLGLNDTSWNTFPEEFREGPVRRAAKLGDVGSSDPSHWQHGLSPDQHDEAHLMWTVSARTAEHRDQNTEGLKAAWHATGAFTVKSCLVGEALVDPTDKAVESTKDGEDAQHYGNKVHFGYRDSIAQPRFKINDKTYGLEDDQPDTPVGAVLLGYEETSFSDVQWQMPELQQPGKEAQPLGKNGCFNAFRVLKQHTHAFEQFLESSAEQLRRQDTSDPDQWTKELVAAKLMGRWRNGVPLADSDDHGDLDPETGMPSELDEKGLNDFDYPDPSQGIDDLEGRPCPVGAHIRRANPRGSRIVQRSANYTRPIVRRGIPYGPLYADKDDDIERGLLGSFMCADLNAQFEALMYDWINMGLHDPRISGTNDPVIGANTEETSRFQIRVDKDTTLVLKGFPRFTDTVGSLYLFVPSITTIGLLAEL